MNLRNILWTYRPRQDGTCQIRIYLHHQGKKKYIGTGINVKPADWDGRRGEVKKTHPLAARINAKIRQQRLELESYFLNGGTWAGLDKKKRSGSDLVRFMTHFIEEAESGLHTLKPNTIKSYAATLRRLKEFSNGSSLHFEDITMTFRQQFRQFLLDKGSGLAGQGKHFSILCRMLRKAHKAGLHQNMIFQDSEFKIAYNDPDEQLYLTESEVAALGKLNLDYQPALAKERDRWMLAYDFLMRFSDVVRITPSGLLNIGGRKFYRYTSVKTSIEAIVPVKERAMSILQAYDFDFSYTANQVANRHIKTVAAMAGLNETVTLNGETGPKSSFVVTHTARRSAATNLYLNKASVELIAKLGGWKKADTVQRYLQASGLDSALMASDMDFFQ